MFIGRGTWLRRSESQDIDLYYKMRTLRTAFGRRRYIDGPELCIVSYWRNGAVQVNPEGFWTRPVLQRILCALPFDWGIRIRRDRVPMLVYRNAYLMNLENRTTFQVNGNVQMGGRYTVTRSDLDAEVAEILNQPPAPPRRRRRRRPRPSQLSSYIPRPSRVDEGVAAAPALEQQMRDMLRSQVRARLIPDPTPVETNSSDPWIAEGGETGATCRHCGSGYGAHFGAWCSPSQIGSQWSPEHAEVPEPLPEYVRPHGCDNSQDGGVSRTCSIRLRSSGMTTGEMAATHRHRNGRRYVLAEGRNVDWNGTMYVPRTMMRDR